MNFFNMFEDRIASVFGTSPQGYTEPFSFKKLAKRAAKEMENETYVINGVDTAPALYTILVSAADDAVMRPLYGSITSEVSQLVEAQAQTKGYAFVAEPLVRFMVDPSLRSGKFSVFAENVDARTLARLRAEEMSFLGGAAAQPQAPAPRQQAAAPQPQPRAAAPVPTPRQAAPARVPAPAPAVAPAPAPAPMAVPAVAPAAQQSSEPPSRSDAGLDVLPASEVSDPYVLGQHAAPARPATRPAPAPAAQPQPAPAQRPAPAPTCLLVDRQSGQTYNVTGPRATIGRERSRGGVVLHDPNVSRRHAELAYDGRGWRIADLNSTNGTLVNDVDVDECALRDGDLITLGLTNLEFREN